jgi:hypothetical protein
MTTQDIGGTELVQLKLRVRPALRAALEDAANAGSPQISINQEAVYRLEQSFAEGRQVDRLIQENHELREMMRRLIASFDAALELIRPDPLAGYRKEIEAMRQEHAADVPPVRRKQA